MTSPFEPQTFELPEAPQLQLELRDAEHTRELGAALIALLEPGEILGLVGDLGAGKTTLMQGLVAALDPQQPVSSPTYALAQHYATDPKILHLDLYRLENVDELETIGYWDELDLQEAVVCVEWIDRLPISWSGDGILCYLDKRRDDEGGQQTSQNEDAAPIRRASIWIAGSATRRLGAETLDALTCLRDAAGPRI